jgi:hypothetical protein
MPNPTPGPAEVRIEALSDPDEALVRKRCAFCGVGPMTMEWRLLDGAVSSPVDQASWFPTGPVREAKMQCSSCKCLAYGLLIGGRVGDDGLLTGLFVSLPDLVRW